MPAKEDVGEAEAGRVAAKERLDDGRGPVDPRHRDRHARVVDEDRLRVDGEHALDERVRRAGQVDVLAVKAL